jgi:hypothetical protein
MTGLFLPDVSVDAWMDHFRCTTCGQVWVAPKEAEHRLLTFVPRAVTAATKSR